MVENSRNDNVAAVFGKGTISVFILFALMKMKLKKIHVNLI